MLYPLVLLVADAEAGWRAETLPHRVWRPTVLVPRGQCLFESLACAEIRLHELPGFARLQAQRLSPFERFGASAARRGGRLMLWLWDADEVAAALQQAGVDKPQFRLVAESLHLTPPSVPGVSTERATQCLERHECTDGAVLRSEVVRAEPLDLSVIRPKAWAHNWLTARAGRAEEAGPGFDGRLAVNGAAVAVAAGMFAFMAYQGGALLGNEQAATALEARLEESLAERGQTSAVSQALQGDVRWIEAYEQAARQLDLGALLGAIRPVLERQGVVLRECEASGGEVRLVTVTVGGEIRLPELLADLGRVAGLRNIRLLQQDELQQATFALQADGFMVVPGAGGDGHGGQ